MYSCGFGNKVYMVFICNRLRNHNKHSQNHNVYELLTTSAGIYLLKSKLVLSLCSFAYLWGLMLLSTSPSLLGKSRSWRVSCCHLAGIERYLPLLLFR